MSGYPVTQAEDGCQAWESAQSECPPIVVTDWNMPKMSGLELCKIIRQQHDLDRVYVLIATSRYEGDDLAVAMDAGANDFLSKPVREDEFLARIRSAENALKHLQSKTELAESDPLTGLLNRRAFVDRAQSVIDDAGQIGSPVSCVMLDIDLFKKFNDDFGHAFGDEVLKIVAEGITMECRDSDLACRLGGDEFCVLLTGASENKGFEVGERIRNRIRKHTGENAGDQFSVKTTLGVATLDESHATIHDLMETADSVLIGAKNEGRNRTLSQSMLCQRKSDIVSYQDDYARELLQSTLARRIATRTPATLNEDDSIESALQAFLEVNVDCACVVNDCNELVGMVTERDFLTVFATGECSDLSVSEIMSCNIARYQPTDPVIRIWESLQRTPMLRNVIVNEKNQPIGLVYRRSLLQLIHELRTS